MQDIVLNRVRRYNPVVLMQDIATVLEHYYIRRLTQFAYRTSRASIGAKNPFLIRNKLFAKASYIKRASEILQIEDTRYSVPSESNSKSRYIVDTRSSSCTCHVGFDGTICKHQVSLTFFIH